MSEQPSAAPVCEHYWAWVSPPGASNSARICMLCHQPSAEWLNHVVEVDRGHSDCVHCEFADQPIPEPLVRDEDRLHEGASGGES